MRDNRSIIEKADIAVSNLVSSGGYLNTEQSDAFVRMIIDQPTMINQCRVVRMNSPKRKIEKIGFGSRILRAAPASGTALVVAQQLQQFSVILLLVVAVLLLPVVPLELLLLLA